MEQPRDVREKCKTIIDSAAAKVGKISTVGALLPPVRKKILTIQIKMIKTLAEVFDKRLTDEAASDVLKAFASEIPPIGILSETPVFVPGVNAVVSTARIGEKYAAQLYGDWLQAGHSRDERP